MKPSDLREIEQAMTKPSEYKAEESWNKADFSIPGHSQGATAEMLAVDAFGIVALRKAAPLLIELWEAARVWSESDGTPDQARARCAVSDALDKLEKLREEDLGH